MSVQKRTTKAGKTRWVARYRDHGKREHSRSFDTQKAAKAWLTEQQRALQRGEWVDERRSPTLDEYWATWAATATTPGTASVRARVYADLGDLRHRQLHAITSPMLRAWLAELQDGRPWIPDDDGLSVNTRINYWSQLTGCFRLAVEDDLIVAPPTAKVKGPRASTAVEPAEIPDPTVVKEIIATCDATGRDTLATMIILAAGTGMRSSEVAGLRWRNVDVTNREIHVVEQAASMHAKTPGEFQWSALKTEKSRRVVPVSTSVLARLAAHRLRHPAGDDEAMFTTATGKMWRSDHVSAAMSRFTVGFHSLRHLYASGLIASGCGVKVVQEMLGHASAATTLDTYTHLWRGQYDQVRDSAEGIVRDICGIGTDSGQPSAVSELPRKVQ